MARISFVELPTAELAASRVFYARVFGWEIVDYGPSYACTATASGVELGLQADPAEATRAPLAVIEVDDLQAALAAVEAAGAAVTVPIFGFPGGRRFQFRDPGGNELAAMQPDPHETPTA